MVKYAQACVASVLDLGFCLTTPSRISRYHTVPVWGGRCYRRKLRLALGPPYRGIRRWGHWIFIEPLLLVHGRARYWCGTYRTAVLVLYSNFKLVARPVDRVGNTTPDLGSL